MNYAKMFTAEAVNELFKIWASGEFYAGIWATLYTTLLATFFALVIGLWAFCWWQAGKTVCCRFPSR